MACALFGKDLQAYPKECITTFGPSPWQSVYASYRTAALLRQVPPEGGVRFQTVPRAVCVVFRVQRVVLGRCGNDP